ncbi:MAG: ThuA domain-containing protein [Planctomycetaceae bacterium]
MRLLPAILLLATSTTFAQTESAQPNVLNLSARVRAETSKGSGRYHTLHKPMAWKATETAIVVCDMWDKHWCPTATRRVAEMAPRMNEVIKAARKQGVLIIHCPSDTLDFYADTPQRKLAQSAPKVETKVPLQGWCNLDEKIEGNRLPIDDSDGGCDCTDEKYKKNYRAWSRQIEAIEIADGDAITASAEAYYLMKQRGINNVIVMGVHTNMCVLGRPFSIRQMCYQGQNVVLMRDMTDTMYNPAMEPKVSHFTGTDLVVEHIERHWCPTITSTDIIGGTEFRFKNDKRKHVVILCAEREYKTEETLPQFALKHLGKDYRVSFVFADAKDRNKLPGMDIVRDADILFISARRRTPLKSQLELIRNHVEAGKPIVGIRTANHAFCLRKGEPKEGLDQWLEFDAEVIGGSYTNHHGNGPKTAIALAETHSHPIMKGIDAKKLTGNGSLYIVSPLMKSATPLLIGSIPNKSPEPIAWTNKTKHGGKVFYTSLGHIDDFKQADFNRLLKNAVDWAAKQDL